MNLKKVMSLMLMVSLSTNSFADSIAQLMQRGEIPAVRDKILNMSGMNVTSLEGLADIPGIGEIEGLGLNDNDLTDIPARAFAACKSLKVLGLKNNKIKSIDTHAFDELEQLEIINLENNRLTRLKKDVFIHSPKLKLIAVNQNPLPHQEVQRLRRALPNTTVTKSFINRQTLIALGIPLLLIGITLAVAFVSAKQTTAGGMLQKKVEAYEQFVALTANAIQRGEWQEARLKYYSALAILNEAKKLGMSDEEYRSKIQDMEKLNRAIQEGSERYAGKEYAEELKRKVSELQAETEIARDNQAYIAVLQKWIDFKQQQVSQLPRGNDRTNLENLAQDSIDEISRKLATPGR